jgi:hypothetical protein
VATLQQRVGCVTEEQRARGDDAGGHRHQHEASMPPVPGLDLVGAVVDELRHLDADCDHQLEKDTTTHALPQLDAS